MTPFVGRGSGSAASDSTARSAATSSSVMGAFSEACHLGHIITLRNKHGLGDFSLLFLVESCPTVRGPKRAREPHARTLELRSQSYGWAQRPILLLSLSLFSPSIRPSFKAVQRLIGGDGGYLGTEGRGRERQWKEQHVFWENQRESSRPATFPSLPQSFRPFPPAVVAYVDVGKNMVKWTSERGRCGRQGRT